MRLSPSEPQSSSQVAQRQPQVSHSVAAPPVAAESLQHTTSLPPHPHQFPLLSRELNGDSLYPQLSTEQQQQQQPINLSESAQERSSFGAAALVSSTSAPAAVNDQARLPYVLDAAASSASSAFRGSPNWPLSIARDEDHLSHPTQRLVGQPTHQHPQHHQQHLHHLHQNPHPEPHAPRYLPDFSQT